MRKFFAELFKNVPKENFKLPMNQFHSVASYEADGVRFEEFQHNNGRFFIIVDVESLEVISMRMGRRVL